MLGMQLLHGQVVALKLGVHRNDLCGTQAMLGAESRIGERLSFQPEFAYGRHLFSKSPHYATNAYHFAVEGRGYLLLRQAQYFCGLYTGLFVSHDRVHWNLEGFDHNATRRYSTSGGLLLGYQQAFLKDFRVDGGVKLGYRKGLWQEQYDPAGNQKSRELYRSQVAGYIYLQVGYAF